MKNILFALVITAASAVAFKMVKKEPYKINTETSKVEWTGKKVTGQHTGEIKIKSGELILEDKNLVGGTIEIDMNAMTCTDMQGEWGDKLVGHLKNEDFFATDKYPSARFNIKSATPLKETGEGKPTHTITGDLTIKDITNEVSFPAIVEVRENAVVAIGDVNVDRTKYGIKYGSSSFFEGIGDKAISDEFNIKFKVAAKK